MNLSRRLSAIHDHLPKGALLADIGTDHGLLMIKAIQSGQAAYAYGLDINPDPLQQAHDNVVRFSMEDKIELILSDGLASFTKEANAFVLAGMGAETIWGIMSDYDFKSDDTIIIQSNTKHYWLRHTLNKEGFKIIKEIYLLDQGKDVFIQIVKKVEPESMSECQAYLGAYLLDHPSDEFNAYLEQRMNYLDKIKHNNTFLLAEYECIIKQIKKGATHE